mmetsp:Transcript_277/g.956  ORF Transcript_277/g.956 Transcript_277/m.956 type:complete len:158 (+) Transcript_277:608-1081(+)
MIWTPLVTAMKMVCAGPRFFARDEVDSRYHPFILRFFISSCREMCWGDQPCHHYRTRDSVSTINSVVLITSVMTTSISMFWIVGKLSHIQELRASTPRCVCFCSDTTHRKAMEIICRWHKRFMSIVRGIFKKNLLMHTRGIHSLRFGTFALLFLLFL